jgi:hypothetical protein
MIKHMNKASKIFRYMYVSERVEECCKLLQQKLFVNVFFCLFFFVACYHGDDMLEGHVLLPIIMLLDGQYCKEIHLQWYTASFNF